MVLLKEPRLRATVAVTLGLGCPELIAGLTLLFFNFLRLAKCIFHSVTDAVGSFHGSGIPCIPTLTTESCIFCSRKQHRPETAHPWSSYMCMERSKVSLPWLLATAGGLAVQDIHGKDETLANHHVRKARHTCCSHADTLTRNL